MPTFGFAIILVVFSGAVYHLAQKSIPGGIHPVFSLLVTYVVALIVSVLLLPFFPLGSASPAGVSRIHWSSALVGLSIVGVEIGFLLVYRAGWPVSTGSAAANAAIAVILIPTGIVFFRERLSAANLLGVVLCLAGLLLVVRR